MDLAQNDDDVFDEGMHGGEDLRATLDGHANYDNQREHEPGNEANG